MSVVYQEETFAACQTEIEALATGQWEEMAKEFEGIPLDPQWDLYRRVENAGSGVLVTAREEGKLVGYVGAAIMQFASSKDVKTANGLPYFVVPCWARGVILRDMMKHLFKVLKARGVRLATLKTHPWASAAPILEHLKMRPIETLYMIDLEGANHA